MRWKKINHYLYKKCRKHSSESQRKQHYKSTMTTLMDRSGEFYVKKQILDRIELLKDESPQYASLKWMYHL